MLRVIVVGVGPIGLSCAHAVHAERDMKLVGLVDLDPAKRGKRLTQLADESGTAAPNADAGPAVTESLDAAVAGGADVAILTTSSDFRVVAPTIRELLKRGLAVVSSCEQMVWPWYRHEALGHAIDADAKAAGRAVLGTGVNPGFVMDFAAVALSCMVRRVTAVRCERRVDAGLRRRPLQAKVGATMTVERFRELAAQDKIGHEGLPESVAMIAAGLGRRAEPGSVAITLDPVVAEKSLPSALGLIQPGQVAGIHNVGKWSGDGLTIELDLTMAVGTTEPRDVVTLDGPVQVRCKIPGGLPGDSATVAAMINHVRAVHKAVPGLRTMLDMPVAGCVGRD
ncbi:MAG: hypothetical protein K8S99_06835 [Planctomycetes bacterium]|nr:hypothetical protein [Planctomycetota bacterium]